jgi:hypothetical protein
VAHERGLLVVRCARRAFLRGGDWEVGLRIARNVDPTSKGGGDPKHRAELRGGSD